MRTRPTAVFMVFGTKGDVYPIAAIAAAFASDQKQYDVAFITHSAHENLRGHLGAKGVAYFPIYSPPVLSSPEDNDTAGSTELPFCKQKKEITRKHRQECLSTVERIYGEGPTIDGDLFIINFFAMVGVLQNFFMFVVSLPLLISFHIVPLLLLNANLGKNSLFCTNIFGKLRLIGWEDIIHWMWPLFSEDWGTWRSHDLQLSFWPFTDPVTGLPTWHDRPASPLLLYGFSPEVVERPGYWPSNVRVCGFWFLPVEWQFSCPRCEEISCLISLRKMKAEDELCSNHTELKTFLDSSADQPIFISLSSIGSMGYLRNPKAFLRVLQSVLNITCHRFILFSAGYGPLDAAIKIFAQAPPASEQMQSSEDQSYLFGGRLFCFSGSMPYNWLFPRCAAAIHHGGSGSTAAALLAGIPQIVCPFILDQFYWAERMFWLGVAPAPLKSTSLVPDKDDDCCILESANVLIGAINYALSPEVKSRASQIAEKLSTEDGVSKALQIIKEEINATN